MTRTFPNYSGQWNDLVVVQNVESYLLLSCVAVSSIEFLFRVMSAQTMSMTDTMSDSLGRSLKPGGEKPDNETKLGSLKKAVCNMSASFRNSLTRRGRRNSRVMSVAFGDEHDVDEIAGCRRLPHLSWRNCFLLSMMIITCCRLVQFRLRSVLCSVECILESSIYSVVSSGIRILGTCPSGISYEC
ncbi:hypothetical protein RND81_06G073300 [Saponaria officinalis]|uniref:Uncharacterized protein n=1 Tax=Saponaria officinalis TaxID=3572 RepID=A0AAW1K8T8_SAPOF